MRRTASILGAAALVLATAYVGAPVALGVGAAGAMASGLCDGKAPTVAASTGAITGTDGDDVIATTGGEWSSVDGLGGNDTICLTTPSETYLDIEVIREGKVKAGEGDDVVIVDGTTQGTIKAALGAGNDRYVGGANTDVVHADSVDVTADVAYVRPAAGPNDDVIDTGQGRDRVVTLAAAGAFNNDTMTGSGDLIVEYIGAMGPTGSVDFSRATSGALIFPRQGRVSPLAEGPLVVRNDLRAAYVHSTVVLRWTGTVNTFTFGDTWSGDAAASAAQLPIEFSGTDASEDLIIHGPINDIYTGLGQDTIRVAPTSPGLTLGYIEGGREPDELTIEATCRRLELDLTDEITCTSTSGTGSGQVAGIKKLSVVITRPGASRIIATGTKRREALYLSGTYVIVRAGGGSDRVSVRAKRAHVRLGRGNDQAWLRGGRHAVVLGGGGNDRLVAQPIRRKLRGYSRAVGGPGRDRCRARVIRGCER